MYTRAIVPILLPFAILFHGCDRGSVPTEISTPTVAEAIAIARHVPNHHVVVFASAQVPGTFEERVAASGGVVERVVSAVGLMVVSGLGEESVSALRADSEVLAVEPDAMFDPAAMLEPAGELALGIRAYERSDVQIESHGDPTAAAFFSDRKSVV